MTLVPTVVLIVGSEPFANRPLFSADGGDLWSANQIASDYYHEQ